MSAVRPLRRFGVYHWDTFDRPGEDTTLLDSFDSIEEAALYLLVQYGPNAEGQHIRPNGAGLRGDLRF